MAQVWKSPSGIVGGLPSLINEKDDDDDDVSYKSLEGVCAVEARFVFVALDNNSEGKNKVVAIPQLSEEMQRTARWEVGAAKHEERMKQKM